MTSQNLCPEIRWGIVGAGLISSWFVADLVLQHNNAPVTHAVTAIGTSSAAKGKAFVAKNIPSCYQFPTPAVYEDYASVYNDPNVDIVYIGTPHAFHRQNCLDAIAAGKHVLCEKPFTINAKEARQVLDAAKEKGVFIMEAMWTRFNPLVIALQQKLHVETVIGDVRRTFCDFGLDMKVRELGDQSRLKNRALGAGSLLDIGIYSLTWGLLTLEDRPGEGLRNMEISASQTLEDGIDSATSVLLNFHGNGRQGILTSTLDSKTDEAFCRIEGTGGYILVKGKGASMPKTFTVYSKGASATDGRTAELSFDFEGMGFHFEADAVALDVLAGRTENATMPPRRDPEGLGDSGRD